MATALDTMIANLNVMVAALEASRDPEVLKEHMVNPLQAHRNAQVFRTAFEQFDAERRNFPELLTDGELERAWGEGRLALSEAHNMPCGVQDRIADNIQRYTDEKQVRDSLA